MKKKVVSLLLALALTLGLAVPAAAAPTGQTLAYTTDKVLWVGPIPLAGLVVISDEYYVPMEVLRENYGNIQCPIPLSFYSSAFSNDEGDDFTLTLDYSGKWTDNKAIAVKPEMCTIPGLELGPVTPSKTPVKIVDKRTTPYQYVTLPGSVVYDLGGHYPMVRLKSIGEYYGYREDGDGVHICEPSAGDQIPAVIWEENLAGQAAKSLRVKDPKAALKAFHDYLVNGLTHKDFMDSAYFKKNDPLRHERLQQMQENYKVFNNVALASRYGDCESYSQIFKAMCLQAGIPCEVMIDSGTYHQWNRVWLWGQWYHVDVTFDDPGGAKPTLRHTYFLISAEKMAKAHTWTDTDYAVPAK